MAGTPATTPRLAIPRYGDLDLADIGAIANSISDRVDTVVPLFTSGLLAARPSTGAGIVDRFYWATDTKELYRDAGGGSPTWEFVTRRDEALLTALPGTPYDGQVINLQLDATAGINGRFRYRAGSASAYKWEIVGQAPELLATADAAVTINTTGYADYTGGPSLAIPFAGDWDFFWGVHDFQSGVNGSTYAGLSVGGATPVAGEELRVSTSSASTGSVPGSGSRRKAGVAAAATAKLQHKMVTANGAAVGRWLRARPVRIG